MRQPIRSMGMQRYDTTNNWSPRQGSGSWWNIQEKEVSSKVEYLGHIVSHEGFKVDPNKIKAMIDQLIPKALKNLRGFLGLTGYYRKFVLNYGRIEALLMTLTKKDAFSQTPVSTKDF